MQRTLLVFVLTNLICTLPLTAQVSNEAILERLNSVEEALRSLERQIAVLNGSLRPATPPPSPVSDMPAVVMQSRGSYVKGDTMAKVVIVEFSDFECPFCGRHATSVYPELLSKFVNTGRVVYQFRNLPLEQIHPNARKAAEAAECAGEQGKFWEFHDVLFANQKTLTFPDLNNHARALSLNIPTFASCLRQSKTAAKIKADVDEAKQLGLTGTPAFIVGEIRSDGSVIATRKIIGSQPLAIFETVLNELLTKP
jgi:protein-disulfide isomerase